MQISPLFIRADSSQSMGAGHIMRMIALADVWKSLGGKVVFICAEILSNQNDMLKEKGFDVMRLNTPIGSPQDAQTTNSIINGEKSWVIIDGYHFDSTYQGSVQESGCRVLIVDDEALLPFYFGHAVLNPNIFATPSLYAQKSNDVTFLCGPKYALLRSEFKETMGKSVIHPEAKKILITFGGSDPASLTGKTLHALNQIKNPIDVKVVIGSGFPEKENLKALASRLSYRAELVENAKMSHLMAWADIAISASGSTCWELCLTGVPSILISAAGNQILNGKTLHEKGMAHYLGHFDSVNEKTISQESENLLRDYSRRKQMSDLAKLCVDLQGPNRVANFMTTGAMS